MLPIIEKLLILQDRDRRLLRVRAEVVAVPGQRLVLQNRLPPVRPSTRRSRSRASILRAIARN